MVKLQRTVFLLRSNDVTVEHSQHTQISGLHFPYLVQYFWEHFTLFPPTYSPSLPGSRQIYKYPSPGRQAVQIICASSFPLINTQQEMDIWPTELRGRENWGCSREKKIRPTATPLPWSGKSHRVFAHERDHHPAYQAGWNLTDVGCSVWGLFALHS